MCRKKYCDLCLKKFYGELPPKIRHSVSSGWNCPACRNACCCAACRRTKAKSLDQFVATYNAANINPKKSGDVLMSPATSIACGLVYFGDAFVLGGNFADGNTASSTTS